MRTLTINIPDIKRADIFAGSPILIFLIMGFKIPSFSFLFSSSEIKNTPERNAIATKKP